MSLRRLALSLVILCGMVCGASGIMLIDSGSVSVNGINPDNSSTPGDNSGWQYEGTFSNFLGTPIAPLYFMTAKHIGAYVGEPFTFHGETFTTTEVDPDPDTDLQILKVDHPFACYAPLYSQNGTEIGQELHVFGRGTERGDPITFEGTSRGWSWGAWTGVERWGRNLVTAILPNDDVKAWYLLQAAFDAPGLVHEAHLSVGDSGGGLFILQDGLWRLAGINYGVDDVATKSDGSDAFAAAIFDARGYYVQDANNDWVLIPDDGVNVPTNFYCTQVSSRLAWIQGVIQSDPTALGSESFNNWAHAYFTPSQLADSSVSGANADPDGDGIPNLLEFAFNLDPTFAEPVTMTADTGLRGLPLIRIERVTPSDTRLTVEFVRRTATSGSGLTYAVQFTASIDPATANWQTGGPETVTSINSRWERVKVTDTVSIGSRALTRFARVAVTQNNISATARVLPRNAARKH